MSTAGMRYGEHWHAVRPEYAYAPDGTGAIAICGRTTQVTVLCWDSQTIPNLLRCPHCLAAEPIDVLPDVPAPDAPPPGARLWEIYAEAWAHLPLTDVATIPIRTTLALHSADNPLEELLVAVWDQEAEWRLDERLAAAGRWAR